MDEINYIVVGLGINVNIDHFPEDLSDKATSLQIEEEERSRELHWQRKC